MKAGDIVEMNGISHGQCHNKPTDDPLHLLGRLAEVKEMVTNHKIFMTPLDYDYTLWFSGRYLKLSSNDNK